MDMQIKRIKGLTQADRERVLAEQEFEFEINGRTIIVQAVNEYAAKRKAQELVDRRKR